MLAGFLAQLNYPPALHGRSTARSFFRAHPKVPAWGGSRLRPSRTDDSVSRSPPGRRAPPARSGPQPDAPEPAHLGHPPLRQPVSGDGGRHVLLAGDREDLLRGVEDLRCPGPGTLEAQTAPPARTLDNTPAIAPVLAPLHPPPVR